MTGLPRWVGVAAVAVVVTLNVVAGGMRSITLVQALQYWFKLVAIALPVLVAFAVDPARGAASCSPATGPTAAPGLGGASPAAEIYSLMLATFLGTMGLPHVLVRFYTNVDGGSARATTVRVIALLGVFYAFPTMAGVLDAPLDAATRAGQADSLLLALPAQPRSAACWVTCWPRWSPPARSRPSWRRRPGWWWPRPGCCPPTCCAAGSATSGRPPWWPDWCRWLIALPTTSLDISRVVGMAFAVAASTFCPLLVLGIWWRGLTTAGAIAGLIVGGGAVAGCAGYVGGVPGVLPGSLDSLLGQPAVGSVPAAFATMVVVSLPTRSSVTPRADAVLAKLHLPSAARRSAGFDPRDHAALPGGSPIRPGCGPPPGWVP